MDLSEARLLPSLVPSINRALPTGKRLLNCARVPATIFGQSEGRVEYGINNVALKGCELVAGAPPSSAAATAPLMAPNHRLLGNRNPDTRSVARPSDDGLYVGHEAPAPTQI